MLRDHISKYYFDGNYNCAESVLRAGNDYYNLGIEDRDMILFAGFGGGMQTGNACGAVLSGIGMLSMKYVEAKAHESEDIKPAAEILVNKIKERFGSVQCCDIKPQAFNEERRCYSAVTEICDIIEGVLNEYEAKFNRF